MFLSDFQVVQMQLPPLDSIPMPLHIVDFPGNNRRDSYTPMPNYLYFCRKWHDSSDVTALWRIKKKIAFTSTEFPQFFKHISKENYLLSKVMAFFCLIE